MDEDIYVKQPKGFVIASSKDKFYLLKNALYGLKQAPRAWYNRIDKYQLKLGFNRSMNESTLYVKQVGCDLMIISLYVDDLLLIGSSCTLVENFKCEMNKMFEMTDLGEMTYSHGMEILQS